MPHKKSIQIIIIIKKWEKAAIKYNAFQKRSNFGVKQFIMWSKNRKVNLNQLNNINKII